MVCSLILLYFDSPQISIISNTTIKLLTSVTTYQNSLIIAFLVPKGLRRVVFTELFYLQITAEVSKIKKCTQRGLYFTLYGLLKYFNILQYHGVKRLLHDIWSVVTSEENLWDYSGFYKDYFIAILWYSWITVWDLA